MSFLITWVNHLAPGTGLTRPEANLWVIGMFQQKHETDKGGAFYTSMTLLRIELYKKKINLYHCNQL